MGIYETQRSSGSWHSYVNADPNITLQRAACECIFVTFDNFVESGVKHHKPNQTKLCISNY
jgi:hypothetical protein